MCNLIVIYQIPKCNNIHSAIIELPRVANWQTQTHTVCRWTIILVGIDVTTNVRSPHAQRSIELNFARVHVKNRTTYICNIRWVMTRAHSADRHRYRPKTIDRVWQGQHASTTAKTPTCRLIEAISIVENTYSCGKSNYIVQGTFGYNGL